VIEYVLFDTETTGNSDEDRIIQIGALFINSRGRVKYFDELCKSDIDIKIEAMEVHNITPELIADKKSFKESHFFRGKNIFSYYIISYKVATCHFYILALSSI
jgi:DNA polymerase III alpha subunit (gram-positive type)